MSVSNNADDLDPSAKRAIEQSVGFSEPARPASMILGLIAGTIAAVICAVGWAAFTLGNWHTAWPRCYCPWGDSRIRS